MNSIILVTYVYLNMRMPYIVEHRVEQKGGTIIVYQGMLTVIPITVLSWNFIYQDH
jgi:hypothetical protein